MKEFAEAPSLLVGEQGKHVSPKLVIVCGFDSRQYHELPCSFTVNLVIFRSRRLGEVDLLETPPDNKNRELAQLYFQVNPIRSAIAHALIDKKRAGVGSAIENAEQYYQKAKQIFKTKNIGN